MKRIRSIYIDDSELDLISADAKSHGLSFNEYIVELIKTSVSPRRVIDNNIKYIHELNNAPDDDITDKKEQINNSLRLIKDSLDKLLSKV